jgi:hypothetical protein
MATRGAGDPDVLTVAVRVRPGASRTRVGGCRPGPYGPAVLVEVTAPAVDGRATEAARRALARALGVRAATVSLRAGAASRDKLFSVAGAGDALADRLDALRSGPA